MNSNNTHTLNATAALLREVLQPRPAPQADIEVPALKIEPGTSADAVANTAADIVRNLISVCNKRTSCLDDFNYECAMTGFSVGHDTVQALAEDGDFVIAAAAQEVFRRAMYGFRPLPVHADGKREMRECATAAAKAIRGLLFKQQSLALN